MKIRLIAILTLFASLALGQSMEELCTMEDGQISCRIRADQPQEKIDTLLMQLGLPRVVVDSMEASRSRSQGWEIRLEGEVLVMSKSMGDLMGFLEDESMILGNEMETGGGFEMYLPARFGINRFKRQSVFRVADDKSLFLLRGFPSAQRVFLSGNFNQWSTRNTPMVQTDSGWVAQVKLIPGKYHYKYIVDGRWHLDPMNTYTERDGQGNENSVFYQTNYTFELENYQNANRVIVAGDFNDWNERQLRMYKSKNGWNIPAYLSEGTHEYKFIVNGTWMTDPANPNVVDDGSGNLNSVLAIGDTVLFELRGFEDATQVILTGSFNHWNESQLKMDRENGKWIASYVLGPGNHEYKFIVDGKWMHDPANPVTVGKGNYTNSVRVVDPNTSFYLEGYLDFENARLSGNFIDWSPFGYTMLPTFQGWELNLYLDPGKYLYKFRVGDIWILDPTNDQIEENQYQTGNSVKWVQWRELR